MSRSSMGKDFAKMQLVRAIQMLPWGARKAAWEALDPEFRRQNQLTYEARKARISGFIVDGESGVFEGSSTDEVMLRIYAVKRRWATRTVAVLNEFFRGRGGSYLDIGANIGLTTVPIAKNPLIQCIAFEPDPSNFANLQRNVARNINTMNVQMHQLALFDREGTLSFALSDDNMGDHRIIRSSPTGRKVIEVCGVRLDSIVDRVASPLAVKMDVQGAESSVISGGEQILAQAELIILEFCPFMISQMGGSVDTILSYLRKFRLVATVPGEGESELDYREASVVCEELSEFYEKSLGNENSFLDIYARR